MDGQTVTLHVLFSIIEAFISVSFCGTNAMNKTEDIQNRVLFCCVHTREQHWITIRKSGTKQKCQP